MAVAGWLVALAIEIYAIYLRARLDKLESDGQAISTKPG